MKRKYVFIFCVIGIAFSAIISTLVSPSVKSAEKGVSIRLVGRQHFPSTTTSERSKASRIVRLNPQGTTTSSPSTTSTLGGISNNLSIPTTTQYLMPALQMPVVQRTPPPIVVSPIIVPTTSIPQSISTTTLAPVPPASPTGLTPTPAWLASMLETYTNEIVSIYNIGLDGSNGGNRASYFPFCNSDPGGMDFTQCSLIVLIVWEACGHLDSGALCSVSKSIGAPILECQTILPDGSLLIGVLFAPNVNPFDGVAQSVMFNHTIFSSDAPTVIQAISAAQTYPDGTFMSC